MSDLNENIVKKVLEWISYADDDLNMAKHGLTIEIGNPYRLIAFHAQQCVEKYLKAYLVYRRIDFPYTHDISQLIELCSEVADWAKEIMEANKLTVYASVFRYPGVDRPINKSDAQVAINIAINVRNVVRRELLKEGFKLRDE